MFESPFGVNTPQHKTEEFMEAQIVFVADMFVEDYVGGAELTTQALIDSSPLNVYRLRSRDVSLENLEAGHAKHWVFGNWATMDPSLIPTIVTNMSYSVLEYDYKYCKYRSPEKHLFATGEECDCEFDPHGKLMSTFLYGARSLWWMSEKQMMRYHSTFPFLTEKPNVVLSSVFDNNTFVAFNALKDKYKDTKREGWVVLGSSSWIKGAAAAETWCRENNKKYEVIWNEPYEQVLEKLAQAEGFVYLPEGGDTCPRMVIEAKLLGCELHLNDNVEHKDELWFNTDDPFDTEAYLFAARERFWNGIKSAMNYNASISGYTTTLNCKKNKYPWKKSVQSMLAFCDEVVIVDGGSTDGTWEEVEKLASKNEKIVAVQNSRDWNHPRFAVFDGEQKAYARSLCTKEFCWQMDADEIVHENDYEKIKNMMRYFPTEVDLISLPVIEYWGSHEKVRADINPWKWRLSRNLPHITHGIPLEFRRTDDDGNLYAHPGTDGCDYINAENYHVIPHASFYTGDIHALRIQALEGNKDALEKYGEWFDRTVEMLPGVHHYSWFDLERKIKTYKNYWQKHWESLYGISQEDTAENNMFFDKPWSKVTNKEIKALASLLGEKTGGHIFHSKFDEKNVTPHINVSQGAPALMKKG